MNPSALFIRRPVATILLAIGTVLAGMAAYFELPVAALPSADFPTISVSAQMVGASPDTMASSVATPLIKQFETIGGIDTIDASSSLGRSWITLQFDLSRDIDAAAADVQAAIARAQRSLPRNMTSLPSYSKSNPAGSPVIYLALTGDGLPLTVMDDVAQNILSPALSTISGVAQAQVFGSKTYALRVEVDPRKLSSRGLTLRDVTSALSDANDQTPLGSIADDQQSLSLDMPSQRTNAAEFRSLIIAQEAGRFVRLHDVARVVDSVQNPNQAGWFDGKPSIIMAVLRQPDANTVEVVDAIRARLPLLQESLPAGMRIETLSDAAEPIRAAVADVQATMALTIGLVILVIYMFLGRVMPTLIPSLAVPLSLIAAFGGMYVLGLSIDNISLLALTLAVGLVVDDAIVMLENIMRHIEAGMPPLEAALKGSREVTGTIISMTLSLVAVFLPILLMGGVVGRVLNEFGLVVALAIMASMVVSLTVTPMLAARLAPAQAGHKAKPSVAQGFTNIYGRAVGWCLGHRLLVMLVFVTSFAGSGWLYTTLPQSFFPTEDTGSIAISVRARQDISYPAMRKLHVQVADIVAADPSMAHTASFVGGGAANSGFVRAQLIAREDRPSMDEVLANLRKSLSGVAGVQVSLNPQQSLRFGGRSTQSQYQVVLQSINAAEARQWSETLADAMRADTDTFVEVASDLENGALQAQIIVDNDRAASLGISTADLREALSVGFGDFAATQIQSTSSSYDVIVEYDAEFGWTDQALGDIRIEGKDGALVPLSSFARVTRASGPITVNQAGQLAAITLSFNLPEGVALGAATARIDALKAEIGLPNSVLTRYAGAAQIFREATDNTNLLIGAAVLTIYLVLGVLYESFIHPLTILSGLPSAALGALAALKYYEFDLSIIALIGLLMLIGIVKKNAIMMIDVALVLTRDEGRNASEAIHIAAVRRFRPIMMTTFCALLAAVPIALGTGVSSELRQPLGVAVVGGLLVSQVLTLFITPVIFVELERLSTFTRRLWTR
jgi:hydrophobic/amphiphilic exporter-1 (mainly G- bacteria), HAE1 family